MCFLFSILVLLIFSYTILYGLMTALFAGLMHWNMVRFFVVRPLLAIHKKEIRANDNF